METRLKSKNKRANKQVLVKENNDPGGGGWELRTRLKSQTQEGWRASRSRSPSSPSLPFSFLLSLPPGREVWGLGREV